MKLYQLSEVKSKIQGPGWELGVKPTEHYLRNSKDPFKYWTPQEIIQVFLNRAGYAANRIIRQNNLDPSEKEDLEQAGLTRALEKLHDLAHHNSRISGNRLYTYIVNSLYDWMLQGGGKGEDWRSTTAKDLRLQKSPRDLPAIPTARDARRPRPQQIVPEHPKAAGLQFGAEEPRDDLQDIEHRDELEHLVDQIANNKTREIMRRYLGIKGKQPIYAQDLAPEFKVSPQYIGLHIKKGLKELDAIVKSHQ